MFFDDFPKLIHTHSIEKVDIEYINRLDDASLCTDGKISKAALLTREVEIVTDCCGSYFVNTNSYHEVRRKTRIVSIGIIKL